MIKQSVDQKIEIRFAGRNDVPVIFSFIRALAEYEKLAHEVIATEQNLEESLFPRTGLATANSPTPPTVLIASLGEMPAGFALFFANYSTFLGRSGIHLEDLFVIPEARGLGIGEALLKKVAAIAVERSAGRLEWAVLDWNKPAIDFYRRLGANPLADWTTFRVDGEALMALAAQGRLVAPTVINTDESI